ncbi:hypothetical protein TS85_23370 [Sphingomonas hengshuiensis]|uniref:Uncharacterized protein n=2 Tax=Sphingomonas hengshuiensis TaxID=1609977 RepID=A0A7U5BF81_9SPHN|nr:hypothetical protein TS85_23370 [Sphingomonas hengshuiensis]
MAGLLALASLWAMPATAQRVLEVPATAGWKHAETGVILRAALTGLPRTRLTDSSNAELDVAAQYGDPDDISLTLYIFRPALQSAPMWFDRAETQIQQRGTFGDPAPTSAPRAFARSPGGSASALRRVYVPSKPPYRSTGVAMIPLGE